MAKLDSGLMAEIDAELAADPAMKRRVDRELAKLRREQARLAAKGVKPTAVDALAHAIAESLAEAVLGLEGYDTPNRRLSAYKNADVKRVRALARAYLATRPE